MPSKGKTAKRELYSGRNGQNPGSMALRSLSDVAHILGLSKSQVNRAEQSAFRKLKQALAS